MRMLLTGGAGYVGSACLRWMLACGHDVIAFDNLCEGNAGSVPEGRLIVGDLDDRTALVEAMEKSQAEVVLHFAARASVPDSIADPEAYYRVNVLGTKNVLDAMRQVGINRIVFSSTAATYGFFSEMPLRETSPQLPETPYGSTKLAAEWMIKEYAHAYGMGYSIFRYFNASGADPDGKYGEARKHEAHLIPLIFRAALGLLPKIMIYGDDFETRDGTCVRDYIHTDDLAQAHLLAAEALRPDSRMIFNLGIGQGATVREVLTACEEVVGHPIPHQIVGRRPGDPGILIASPEKISRELGWSPRFPHIRDIVTTAWRWHQTHPLGYETDQRKMSS